MPAGTHWDLPVGTSLSMLDGNNHLRINLKALGSRLQVSSGHTKILITTSSSSMKKLQVVTREDICLSLAGAIMINRWTTSASTTDWRPLRYKTLPYRTHCMNTHNDRPQWGTQLPTFNRINNSRTRTGTLCSNTSTFNRHSDRPCQHSPWGKSIPRVSR